MNPVKTAVSALLLASSLCPVCEAGALQWEKTHIELVAQPEQPEVAADFNFRNAGPRPVTIVDIATSCACTAATASKNTYGPGESGQIHVVFTVLNQTGLNQKTIQVTTDDAPQAPASLILEVRILQYASVEPRLIYWKMGGDESEQRILCSAESDHRITLSGVTCSLPDISATIDAVEPGRKYAVRLRSPARSGHATAIIELKVEVAGVGTRVINAYAYYK